MKQAKRQETDLPQICQEWKERVHLCREGFRASDCDANKRVHRSFLPERIENRGPRAGLRHYLPLRQVATCNRCLAVKTRAADSPRPEPQGSAGQKTPRPTLHWFLTHWSLPSQASVFRKLTYIRIFLQSLCDRKYIVTCRFSLSTDCCAKIINTFLPLITSTIGLP